MKRLFFAALVLLLVACESKTVSLYPAPSQTPLVSAQIIEPSAATSAPAATHEPIPEQTPSATLAETVTEALSVSLVANDNGFKLIPENDDNFYVAQTLQIPHSQKIVHIIRKIENDGTAEGRYFESAVVITPDTQEMHIYPMTKWRKRSISS